MRATRAVIWELGALLLLGALGPSAGCGPNGVRRVVASNGGTGGQEQSGGSGGENTGGRGTGGDGTGGRGTGGAVVVDAAPDLARDMGSSVTPPGPDAAIDLAPDVNAMEAPPPDVMGAPCVSSTNGGWMNNSFPARTGTFTATFEATPSASPGDSVIGLSSGAANAYTALAANVRFAPSGNIDARNAGAYAAAATIPFAANMIYRFRMVVNVGAHTYSVFVTGPSGQEQTLAMGYDFRTGQENVTSLSSWATMAAGANMLKTCGFALQ